ncbi:peptide ABC transporter substrate-binding protein [Listeria booriae]|uniref:Peptide ABC transporter substrate-binding protein n=1 Tax=Listeria booriae TaxID=1552123 RepID=A0A7X0Z1S7_9LIST|nr:peptide ABC transporter substrate-binding protein [Listeria booriae]MBC2024866.1 peptide ABC transporter substrate-binding protein [Listeria booriae]MBC2049091.1 peptide ABC transporter substrate-binding protein [Listeria booriae]MBC2167674.1 peptide ABC transporter substrate-binding protein [Listeria booriae]MBC2194947.1 peptide ABC transporter substrate-binding protein [Listeria booriae]MBC2325846.1 peptide ABC transporter substrate-binding protein [Listeria booriae]
MKKSKLFLVLGLTLVLSLVLAACGGGSDSKSGSGGSKDSEQVLNLTESALIPSADSTKADDAVGLNVINQTNEGLYALDKDGVAQPAGATEKATVSDDKKVYTFKLRDDAKWSNGDPVTAKDYVYSWQRAVDPKTAATYSYLFDGLVQNASEIIKGEKKPSELGIKAVDDTTLEVTLVQPTAYFDSLLAFPTFFPLNQKFVEEKGDKYALDSDSILYNGPFKLTGWNGTGKTWSYVPNDTYWDKKAVKLKKINVQVVQDPGTGVNLYNTGKVDKTILSGEYAAQNKNKDDYLVEEQSSVFYIKFNQERNGKKTPLANENIRKALALSMDKQSYVDTVLQNGSIPANGLVPRKFTFDPKDNKDYRDEVGDVGTYDLDAAKKAWTQGLKELGVTSLNLEFTSDDTENAKKSSEFLQDQWEKNLSGLKVTLKNVPFKIRLANDQKQDYDFSMSAWGPDYQDPSTFLNLFRTGNTQNRMSYSNADYDKIIDQAAGPLAGDTQARWDEMLKAEPILITKDQAIQPLYQRALAFLQQPYVKDLQKNAFGPDYTYKNTYIDGK